MGIIDRLKGIFSRKKESPPSPSYDAFLHGETPEEEVESIVTKLEKIKKKKSKPREPIGNISTEAFLHGDVSDEDVERAINREAEKIRFWYRTGRITAEQAKKMLESLRKGIVVGGKAVGRGTAAAGKWTWEKKHRARAPLFGRIESSGWDTKGLKLIDPKIRSAINKGKVQLRRDAKKIYNEKLADVRPRINAAKQRVKKAMKNYQDMRKKTEDFLQPRDKSGVLDMATNLPQAKAMSMLAGAVEKVTSGTSESGQAQLLAENMREAYNNVLLAGKELKTLQKSESDPKYSEGIMKEALEARASEIASDLGLSGEYKDYLIAEAGKLAYFYGRQYKNDITRFLGRIGMFTRGMTMGAMTWGDVWGLLWDNIKTLIFGPWVWGFFLAVIQWFFVMAYIQPIAPSPFYFILPILTGIFVFMTNAGASTRPWDWLTHFFAGVLVGFSALIFLIAIWTPEDLAEFAGFSSWLIFWIVWAILALFVGVFQLYHSGGFMTVFQISIIILLFGYIALGPYNAYYRTVLDQIKEPLNMAWRSISNAFQDVWLLTTNPTEWYARQQVVNVKAEKPISYPKALEVTRIDAVPDSVPSGENFNIIAIIRNEGKNDIENIAFGYDCPKRSYCNDTDVEVKASLNAGKLEPGESSKITFSGFLAEMGPITRTSRGTVELEFNYTYNTTASLFVEVASEDEISRRQYEETNVWKNVLAVDAGATARLSLNVGPQPLDARSDAETVLISVSNTREDGNIILERGKEIRIKMDETIGTLLECDGTQVDCQLSTDGKIAICYIEPVESDEIVIKPYEFNTILPIFCSFATKDVEASRTGLITAELPEYKFVVKKSKTIMVTLPLGIIYEEEGEEEEAAGSTQKGSALFVKIDPEDEGTNVELWDFRLTEDLRTEVEGSPNHAEFMLDNFEYSSGQTACVVLAVNEEGAGLEDAASVWYIRPGGIIGKEGNMNRGIQESIIAYDCSEGVTGDFGVSRCNNPDKASPIYSAPSLGEYRETIGGTDYTTNTDDSVCNGYIWQPKYELVCADDGQWYTCGVEGVIKSGSGNEYICANTEVYGLQWIECSDKQISIPVGGLTYTCRNNKWVLSCEQACQLADRDGWTCAPAKPADGCGKDIGIEYEKCPEVEGITKGDIIVQYDNENPERGYCDIGNCWCYNVIDPCCIFEQTCSNGVCS
jgi:hypothetical protein